MTTPISGWPQHQRVSTARGWSTLDPASLLGGPEAGLGVAPPQHGRGRDWRIVAMAFAAGLLAIAGVLVYVLGNSSAEPPRARLERAILATDSALTARVTMDVKASSDGVSVSVTATGSVDFATQAASLHMNVLDQTVAVVEVHGVVYVKLGTLMGSAAPGKTWVSIPAATFAGGQSHQLFVTNDPTKAMGAFLKLGGTVAPIGSSTIDGSEDQGYALHLSVANIEAHASELPSAFRSMLGTAKSVPGTAAVTATMYVDPAGHLQATHIVVSADPTGHPASASIDLTMSHFGTSSIPTAPPATQTVTYQQVRGQLGSGSLPLTLPGGAVSAA
jgi:hypothetical protein